MNLRRYVKKPYVPATLWIALLVVAGFWPSYYGHLPFHVPAKNPIIHLHAIIFSGWLIILVAQTIFAAQGRLKRHMAFGRIGIYWGWALVAIGLTAAFHVFQRELASDGLAVARLHLIGPVVDMVLFAPVFALAVRARRDPARHKRLMLVAVSLLLAPALFRLLTTHGISSWQLKYFLWISPPVIGLGWDLARKRGASPIYLIAIVLIPLSGPARLAFGTTPAWAAFTGWLAADPQTPGPNS